LVLKNATNPPGKMYSSNWWKRYTTVCSQIRKRVKLLSATKITKKIRREHPKNSVDLYQLSYNHFISYLFCALFRFVFASAFLAV
jgi:hypothetical protein